MTNKYNEWIFDDPKVLADWQNCAKGPCEWNKFMGLEPEFHAKTKTEDGFVRLNCVAENGTYKTAGLQTKELLGSGIVEIKARFKGGESSWPALWLINERSKKYYEIDIVEYFGDGNKVKSGLFFPKHMDSKLKRLFRPKENTKINKNDWNYYTCEWNKDFVKIAVNGKVVINHKNNGKENNFPQEEEFRMYNLIMSMQYDHGKPKPSQLPLWMDVAYVKYIPTN